MSQCMGATFHFPSSSPSRLKTEFKSLKDKKTYFRSIYFINYYIYKLKMSNIKPTRAQMFYGLRRRPKYEEILSEINPDTTKIIYPNRDAKFLREDPRMTQ